MQVRESIYPNFSKFYIHIHVCTYIQTLKTLCCSSKIKADYICKLIFFKFKIILIIFCLLPSAFFFLHVCIAQGFLLIDSSWVCFTFGITIGWKNSL